MYHLIANAEEVLPVSWPYVVLAIASLLFGGHGLFVSMSKNRKDTVIELMKQVGEQANKIADLSKEIGNNNGKIELLEKQVERVSKEKHKFRSLASRYRMKVLELEVELRERIARITLLESALKSSPDSPVHPLQEQDE